jgi:hypothetical protein
MSYTGKYPCVNHSEHPDRRAEMVGEPRHMCWECYRKAIDEDMEKIQQYNEGRHTVKTGYHPSLTTKLKKMKRKAGEINN